MGRVTGGPEAVIGGFLDAVGPTGTVVVPTFTLTERLGPFGSWYDHQTTPSTVGLITETLRRRPDAQRSFHPVHSVAAVGRLAPMITAQQRNAFGRRSPWCDAGFAQGSPFDLLTRWNAWYVLLGVEFQVQTIMHYLETILVDAVLRRASVAEREALRSQVRRWGSPGIWPAPERMPLGAALAADGTLPPRHHRPGGRVREPFPSRVGSCPGDRPGSARNLARRGVSGLDGRPARSRSGPGGVRGAGRWSAARRPRLRRSPAPAWRGPCRRPEVDYGQVWARPKS